jgi:hypothetical protein
MNAIFLTLFLLGEPPGAECTMQYSTQRTKPLEIVMQASYEFEFPWPVTERYALEWGLHHFNYVLVKDCACMDYGRCPMWMTLRRHCCGCRYQLIWEPVRHSIDNPLHE